MFDCVRPSNFTVMGYDYEMEYLLCDGIYPESTMIKAISGGDDSTGKMVHQVPGGS